MAVDDILQVRVLCVQGPQIGVNVLHAKVISEVTGGATLQEIATAVAGAISGNYTPLLTNAAGFRGVGVTKILPLPRTVESSDILSAGPGIAGANSLPFQVSGVISLRTALPGRHGHGRMYIPFPDESDNVPPGIPTGTYVAGLTGVANNFMGLITVAGATGTTNFRYGLLNRLTGAFTQFTSSISRAVWGTQRRRGGFGRPNIPPF